MIVTQMCAIIIIDSFNVETAETIIKYIHERPESAMEDIQKE